ncbi:sister chromatid cohesion protein-like protein Dcc1 [Paraphoma chrysanthemicola]|nr:sister chromatid cohesion protein-like protein Dcc1 [Paraphoma chrysanthemicola]
MATQQDEGGVPFAIAHEMQHFRLFELPPEIVELIDAPNPPLLSIKSQAVSSAPNAKPAYAVLCAPNATFSLRQVQTSNTLLITEPALEAHGNEIPIPVTRAIASCTATLELHPSDASAVCLLQEQLPSYHVSPGDFDAGGNHKSRVAIFDDVPLSEGQCQSGWNDLMAFEHDGGSWQPSPDALAQVWRSINAAALAEGVKLDSQFLIDDITRAVAEEAHPIGLVKAILTRLSSEEDTSGPWCSLDRGKTVAFAGKTLLEAREGSDFLIAEFTDSWEDTLPEAWRKDAQLSAIDGLYQFPSETTVRAKNSANAHFTIKAPSAGAKPAARKWHEKFGMTRKK